MTVECTAGSVSSFNQREPGGGVWGGPTNPAAAQIFRLSRDVFFPTSARDQILSCNFQNFNFVDVGVPPPPLQGLLTRPWVCPCVATSPHETCVEYETRDHVSVRSALQRYDPMTVFANVTRDKSKSKSHCVFQNNFHSQQKRHARHELETCTVNSGFERETHGCGSNGGSWIVVGEGSRPVSNNPPIHLSWVLNPISWVLGPGPGPCLRPWTGA